MNEVELGAVNIDLEPDTPRPLFSIQSKTLKVLVMRITHLHLVSLICLQSCT